MTTTEAYTAVMRFLGITCDQLTEQTSLVEDLGFDSIDRLALAQDFEDEFDVVFTDDDISSFRTIGDMSQCVLRALERRRIDCEGAPVDKTITGGPAQ